MLNDTDVILAFSDSGWYNDFYRLDLDHLQDDSLVIFDTRNGEVKLESPLDRKLDFLSLKELLNSKFSLAVEDN